MQITKFSVSSTNINYNRIFLLSDTHFGVRANSVEWLDNIKSFFYNFYIPYIKQNLQSGDCLFFLGDFFDNRQLLDIGVLNTGIDVVLALSKILPVYFLTGNHDIYKKNDTDINSIAAFRYIPNVTIFEKPIVATNGNSRILILPWIASSNDKEMYVRANKFDYVFAHTDIKGFRYDNGKEIKTSGTDFYKFKGIKKLFSGHIHKRQEEKNIIYIGSPYHTKRGDIDNKKGVYLFDPKNNSYECVANNFSPIFQRIHLENILELTLDEAIKLLSNNYTDIIVPDKYIHLFNLTKFIDILKDCNYKKIETSSERKRIDEELIDGGEISDIKDILTLIEMSIQDLGHKIDILVKLKLLNRNYYEKASKESIE